MGDKGPKIKESPASKQQSAILQNLETTVGQPIRDVIIPPALKTLGGPGVFDTTLAPADREAITGQFKQAQQQLMNTGVRGGRLEASSRELARNAAQATSGALINARNTGIERALGLVPTALPTSSAQLGARGNIAGQQQQRLTTQAGLDAQAQQQKGESFGALAGLMGGKS